MGRLTNSSVHITPSGNKRNRAALSKGRTPLFCLGRGQVYVRVRVCVYLYVFVRVFLCMALIVHVVATKGVELP